MTNIQGHDLADPEYAELFDELNRRKLVVCIHPNDPPFGSLGKVNAPWAMIEFPLETTRTVGQMMYGGLLERCPEIRFILPHAGGAIPFARERYSDFLQKKDAIAQLNVSITILQVLLIHTPCGRYRNLWNRPISYS